MYTILHSCNLDDIMPPNNSMFEPDNLYEYCCAQCWSTVQIAETQSAVKKFWSTTDDIDEDNTEGWMSAVASYSSPPVNLSYQLLNLIKPGNWINDNVMSIYFELLNKHISSNDHLAGTILVSPLHASHVFHQMVSKEKRKSDLYDLCDALG